MNYQGYEDDDLPRPVVPNIPREEIPVPVFSVPDVSVVVDKAPRRQTYEEWQKKKNLVVLEGRTAGRYNQSPTIPQEPHPQVETFHPALDRKSPLQINNNTAPALPSPSSDSKCDEVVARLEKLLSSYSTQLEGQIHRLGLREEKPRMKDKSVDVFPQQRSVGIQCDLLLPQIPPTTKSTGQQTEIFPDVFDNRRASDSCLAGGFQARGNPAQSDAWCTEMSLATRQYMEKYNLLGDTRSSSNRNVLDGIKEHWRQPRFQVTLVAFGNPILDMSLAVEDGSVRREYNLKANEQQEIPIERLMTLKKDAEERYAKSVQLNPGGSSLNTCRILCALGEQNVLYCGSVGNDENGKKLLGLIAESGVNVCLQNLEDASTAVCLCLIEGANRCLVADIGAATKIQLSWLTSEALVQITPASILYIEGYFIPQRFPICQWLIDHLGATAKIAINLNAKYIVEKLRVEFKYLVQECDLIFGNAAEFAALVEISGHKSITSWLDAVATAAKKDKIFVITNGEAPVRLIEIKSGITKCEEIEVEKVKNVQDTTGAGDAFVAGFFYGYIHAKNPRECVQEGIHVARETLSQIGCHLPPKM